MHVAKSCSSAGMVVVSQEKGEHSERYIVFSSVYFGVVITLSDETLIISRAVGVNSLRCLIMILPN